MVKDSMNDKYLGQPFLLLGHKKTYNKPDKTQQD